MGFLTHSGPITAAEGRRQRKKLIASMARDLRKKDRAHLRQLREGIKAKRVERREKIEAIRGLCKTGLVAARERARERYEALRIRQEREREELRELTRREREAARGVCETKPEIAAAATAEVVQAREHYVSERERVRSEHQGSYHKPPTMTRGEAARARAEARAESDDEVRNDIPHELVPVWEKVKRTIQATPRMSRTEAFLHWVHDNSATVERLINESVSEQLEALEREEKAHARTMRKASRYKRGPEHLAADLDIDADEYREGAESAARDIQEEGWTGDRARAYIANVLPATSSYARGYDDTIRILAERPEPKHVEEPAELPAEPVEEEKPRRARRRHAARGLSLPPSADILESAYAEMNHNTHGPKVLHAAQALAFAVHDGMPAGAARSRLEAEFLTALRQYEADHEEEVPF